jgi:hypothetical protein
MARIGGRGCPQCGSHNTQGFTRGGAQWCFSCNNKWVPCQRTCRGWRLDMHHPDGPSVIGCVDCGVPHRIARTWPEAHNALARQLLDTVDKMDSTIGFLNEGRVSSGGSDQRGRNSELKGPAGT